jgi:hypothetical protein
VCSGGRDVVWCGVCGVLCCAAALEAGAMTWGSSFQTEKAGFLRLVLREGQQHALRVPCALATLTAPPRPPAPAPACALGPYCMR